MKSDWYHLFPFLKRKQGEALALVTLTQVEGSSYRHLGARLLVDSKGCFVGSLSGGCLEERIAQLAIQTLHDGVVRMEKINTEPHFGCPGMLTFVIEKIPAGGLLDIIREAVDARKSLILVTDETGTKLRSTPNLDDEFSQTKMVFVERMALQPRLVVLGWTADQEPIFQMAEVLGWRCDRIVKTPEMVAETRTVAGECVTWCAASEVEGSFEPDDQTAFLIMSHHMVTDFNYLKRVLALSYPYVGLLGSQRRKQRLLHELGEQGALEDLSCLENFYAPAGLDIGGSHPTSIALAIIGEIQAVFSQKGAKPIQSLRNA